MQRSFAVRGVVEGFYGTPWSHGARVEVLAFLASRGMNAYVYAPKDEPKHRAEWRTSYDAEELARFHELAAHADAHGVRLGFAISPGLDIDYESADDRATLFGKLRPLLDAGVPWFLLLVDDIPMQPGLAPRQADLATWLLERLVAARADVSMTLCPTEYVGTRPSPYLSDLGERLPEEIDIMWTGPTVCSPELRAGDARAWAKALGDHRVIVWDNYPVNDGTMQHALHLGAYRGRDPDLVEVVGGILCNPMVQAHASQLPLATAMAFLADPDGYDAAVEWARAVDDLGRGRAAPLAVLARACADSPLATPDTLDLAWRVDTLEDELDGPAWPTAVSDVAQELRAARGLPEAFPATGDALAEEVAPWAQAARAEADAGLGALRLLQQLRPVATMTADGQGRAAAPDPETAMHTAFAMLYQWTAARADEKVVYGPRFAVYPAVIQLPDGQPALDASLAVREDANVVDRLCRLALREYDAWRTAERGALRVLVDGEERALGADGSFDGRGTMVLVRAGRLMTRLVSGDRASGDRASGDRLPFRDPRLQ